MSNIYQNKAEPAFTKHLLLALLGAVTFLAAGCTGERDANDGQVFNTIQLPTDVALNFACEDVGVHPETCVLDDPENPYVNTAILEFQDCTPGAVCKFNLFNAIPPGPTGAKARFYLFATALARRPSGENQFYTALALHELFDANRNVVADTELLRQQALSAYRSVLDNFFGSVTVFGCCPVESPDDVPVPFAVPLNELTAAVLFFTDFTGYARLVEGNPILVKELFLEWGYTYDECTDLNCTNGVVGIAEF